MYELRKVTQLRCRQRTAHTLLPNFAVKTASLGGDCVLPKQILAAGKFCLEDQGLFVACMDSILSKATSFFMLNMANYTCQENENFSCLLDWITNK